MVVRSGPRVLARRSFAIEHLQIVAVAPDEIDLTGEIAEKPRVPVLEPQPQDFDLVEAVPFTV